MFDYVFFELMKIVVLGIALGAAAAAAGFYAFVVSYYLTYRLAVLLKKGLSHIAYSLQMIENNDRKREIIHAEEQVATSH